MVAEEAARAKLRAGGRSNEAAPLGVRGYNHLGSFVVGEAEEVGEGWTAGREWCSVRTIDYEQSGRGDVGLYRDPMALRRKGRERGVRRACTVQVGIVTNPSVWCHGRLGA